MTSEEIKKKVLFITPRHAFTYNDIKENGYQITYPYIGDRSVILRVLREIHFRWKLPFRNIWYCRQKLSGIEVLFLFESLITADYLKWLNCRHPQCKIIMYYDNPCNKNNTPRQFNTDICVLWSGDKKDCKRYGLKYYPKGGYFRSWTVKKEKPRYDIFYVGKDKGRLKYLIHIKKMFEGMGLKVYFHIVGEHRYSFNVKGNYKKFMPYKQVLKKIGESRAILFLSQGAQDGITVRVQESLIHRIKLITDNKKLMDYDFYDSNNIFILGKDKLETLKEFLKTPYKEVKSSFFDGMYFDDFVEYVINNSFV